jgi:hypothetical protein
MPPVLLIGCCNDHWVQEALAVDDGTGEGSSGDDGGLSGSAADDLDEYITQVRLCRGNQGALPGSLPGCHPQIHLALDG